MTELASPLRSALTPPSDPDAVADWLDAITAAAINATRRQMSVVVTEALDAYAASLVNLTASGDPAAFDAAETIWRAWVTESFGGYTAGLYLSGAVNAWITMPGVAGVQIEAAQEWLRFVNEHAVAYQQFATNRVVGASDALWAEIRELTVGKLQSGMRGEDLKNEIQAVTNYSEFRADTIARTESVAAYNNGNLESAVEAARLGFGPVAKQWFSGVDDRTRATHAAAADQMVWIDEPFIVGGVYMQAPHDPNSPAAEVVNCRCRVLFYYDTDPEVEALRKATGRPGPSL